MSARVAPPAAAQLGAMLGGAEFMLILDRPFAAEKLFNAVLAQDPKNAHALDGLRRVKLAKRTSWTFLGHAFGNGYKTQLVTYGGGPSFYTAHGKVTFWVGDGFFGAPAPSTGAWTSLQKITLNGFWEPYYKNFDGYAYVNRTIYPDAPDRTLYDFKGTWNRHPGRESYSVFGGQHDSFLQDDTAQFCARVDHGGQGKDLDPQYRGHGSDPSRKVHRLHADILAVLLHGLPRELRGSR